MIEGWLFPESPRATVELEPAPGAVRPDCWMVGRRNPQALLQCNTYLRTFPAGRGPVHLCIDPGSRIDFPQIEKNLQSLIGDLGEIASFSLNHQDPDVVGNALHLCQANPGISALMSEEVWRLVKHLDLQPRRLHYANAARTPWMAVADQYRWQLVPTPFCHFRGATAFYDPELRTLFSGDLFGALNPLGRIGLWAEESDWRGIAQFHQIYMPAQAALRHAVRQIRALQPAVEVIAPQHGFLIQGDLVPLFLERLENLPVGIDLLALEQVGDYRERYQNILNRMMAAAAGTMGDGDVARKFRDATLRDGFDQLVEARGDRFFVRNDGPAAIVKGFARLVRGESLVLANTLREAVLNASSDEQLPVPNIGAGLEEIGPSDAIGPDGIEMRVS